MDPPKESSAKRFVLELDPDTVAYLQVLTGPDYPEIKDVLEHLIHSAADGVRRPGAWERPWIQQCFGHEWESKLEAHPEVPFFTTPKRST